MEVEIVRWDRNKKNNMENILTNYFSVTADAHNFYTNWKCQEEDDDSYFIGGKDWNNNIKETLDIPTSYNYKYTYSVNLWSVYSNEIEHSHNFVIYSNI